MADQAAEKMCFVISQIGKDDSPERGWADAVLHHIIEPAVTACGYSTPVRADRIADPGVITVQIIQMLRTADLVVADLTNRNPNVYYELGVRHTLQKPTIQIINAAEEIPFDVGMIRTIQFALDLDGAEACRGAMIEQIKAIEGAERGPENPVTLAIGLQELRAQSPDLGSAISTVVGMLGEMNTRLGRIERGQVGTGLQFQGKSAHDLATRLSHLVWYLDRVRQDPEQWKVLEPIHRDIIHAAELLLDSDRHGFMHTIKIPSYLEARLDAYDEHIKSRDEWRKGE